VPYQVTSAITYLKAARTRFEDCVKAPPMSASKANAQYALTNIDNVINQYTPTVKGVLAGEAVLNELIEFRKWAANEGLSTVRLNEVKYKAETYKNYNNTPEVRKAIDAARNEFTNFKPGQDYIDEMTKWCDGLEIAKATAEFDKELESVKDYLNSIVNEWDTKAENYTSGREKVGLPSTYKLVGTEDWVSKFSKSSWTDFNENLKGLDRTFVPNMQYGGGWVKSITSEILKRDLPDAVQAVVTAYDNFKKALLDTLEKELNAEILVDYKNDNNSGSNSNTYHKINYNVNQFSEVCRVIAPEHTKRLQAVLPALEAKKAIIVKQYNDLERAVRDRLVHTAKANQAQWDSWVASQNITKLNYNQAMNDIESWKGKNILFRNANTAFGLPVIDGNGYSIDHADGIFDGRTSLHNRHKEYLAKLNKAQGLDPQTIAAHRITCFHETDEQAIEQSVGTITGIATLYSDNWINLPNGQRVQNGQKKELYLQVTINGFKWTDAFTTPQSSSYTSAKLDDLFNK